MIRAVTTWVSARGKWHPPPPKRPLPPQKTFKNREKIPWGAGASQRRGAWGKNPLTPPPLVTALVVINFYLLNL